MDIQPVRTNEEPLVRRRLTNVFLDYGLFVALGVLIVVFALSSPYFFTQQNLLNIGQSVSVTGIMAAALTVGLIAGQLDLSIGAVLGLSSVVTAISIHDWGWPSPLGVLAGIAAGVVVGLLNGVLIVNVGISSIIATLATALTIAGVSDILTSGQAVPITDPTLQAAVNARPLGIPLPVILMLVIFAAMYVLLMRTRTGWHIYAVGGSSSAAIRAGIKTKPLYAGILVLTAVAAAVAGIVSAGRAGSGGPFFGVNSQFDVLTAVLLGGIGLAGGMGRIERSLAGVALIGVLNNGMTLLSVNTYIQETVRGGVFILAVVMGAIAAKRTAR